MKEKSTEKSQTVKLSELAGELSEELWHDHQGNGWATVIVQGHQEHWRLTSIGFRRWLRGKFLDVFGGVPGRQAEQDAIGMLESVAYYKGKQHEVFTRIAGSEGRIYVDLADSDWTVIEIGPGGWRPVQPSPVRFRRSRGMLSLPLPTEGGDLDDLRRFVNVTGDDDWYLFLACLTAALRPTGPYPALQFRGEQGSAKSTVARVHRSLIDPSAAMLRAEPREVRDLMIAAQSSWCVTLDNVSRIPDWLSDALCRLATGGGFATRELYTDDGEMIFDAMRPVVLTGIEDFVTKGDLRDRTVVIDLEPITEKGRLAEKKLWADFESCRPQLLGTLFNALAGVLAIEPEVEMVRLPRMADFAIHGVALGKVLEWPEGAFFEAYAANRASARALTLEDWAPAPLIMQSIGFDGTATELLAKLEERSGKSRDELHKAGGWPKSSSALSNQLRRLAPDFRAAGWADIRFERSGQMRTIRILDPRTQQEQTGKTPSSPSSASPQGALEFGRGGGGDGVRNDDDDDDDDVVTRKRRRPSSFAADDSDDGDDGVLPPAFLDDLDGEQLKEIYGDEGLEELQEVDA
jgi:hypothetical protein